MFKQILKISFFEIKIKFNKLISLNDTDSVYKKALDAGAVSVMEPADQFYGDRIAGAKDSFGITWWLATHIEDVTPEEIKKRAEEQMRNKP